MTSRFYSLVLVAIVALMAVVPVSAQTITERNQAYAVFGIDTTDSNWYTLYRGKLAMLGTTIAAPKPPKAAFTPEERYQADQFGVTLDSSDATKTKETKPRTRTCLIGTKTVTQPIGPPAPKTA
jgi:hypothetical protein